MTSAVVSNSDVAERYLSLMKQCLTRYLIIDEECRPIWQGSRSAASPDQPLTRLAAWKGLHVGRYRHDRQARQEGRDWPVHGETMAGLRRLDNVQDCVTSVVRDGVPGDLIETGVWRGGTSIFMRAILAAYGDTTRRVWVADSFRGLPKPDAERYPADKGLDLTTTALAIGIDEVKRNFAKYDLLDDQVQFLEGWFKDTLAPAPIEHLSVIRLDGDLYESTMDALSALYPRLSPGGYVIVDDYGCIESCRQAVDDYRAEHGITDTIEPVDWTGAYWRRAG